MRLQIIRCCSFKFTKITRMLDFQMDWSNVFFHISFSCKIFVTLITRVLYFLMDRFYMYLQAALCCKFFVTLITQILDFFMDWFNMLLQITLSCKLFATLMTRILNFLMDWFNMFLQYVSIWNIFCSQSVSYWFSIKQFFSCCSQRCVWEVALGQHQPDLHHDDRLRRPSWGRRLHSRTPELLCHLQYGWLVTIFWSTKIFHW